jgi:hypothetical protein
MSTDFLDVLESQLDEAARHRYGRSAPRSRFGGIALAAASVAAVVIAVVLLSGRGTTHDAHTAQPSQAGPTIGAAARGVEIMVYGRDPAAGKKLASQLSKATGKRAQFSRRGGTFDRQDTEVSWGGDHAAAALAVAEFIGDTPPQLAALRVLPGWGEFQSYPVVVWLGRSTAVTAPRNVLPVRFQDGCPRHPRPVTQADGRRVVASLLLGWPRADRAVTSWSASRGPDGFDLDPFAWSRACGMNRTAATALEFTAGPRESAQILAHVAREGDHLVVWKTEPYQPPG